MSKKEASKAPSHSQSDNLATDMITWSKTIDIKKTKNTDKQFSQGCLCKEPLYVSLGMAKDIAIKIETGVTKMSLTLNDRLIKKFCGHMKHLEGAGAGKTDDTGSNASSLFDLTTRHSHFALESKEDISEEFGGAGQLDGIRHKNLSKSRQIHAKSMSSHYGLTFGNNPTKVYNYGERGSGTQTQGPSQDYHMIKKFHLDSKSLFEDPEFPADNTSVYLDQASTDYEWKRPHEIVKNPKFFVNGYSRFDIQQGELGDCWFLAATANLTLHPHLFEWVVPDDQDFDEDYAGIFHFRFWYFGRWIDICIDDRLPTNDEELAFLHSTEENEFWSALLEKAYAKLNGCYDALRGGAASEAMEDFTGGLVEYFNVADKQHELFQILTKGYERSTLMACSITPQQDEEVESRTPEGLIRGHAYSITKVTEVLLTTAEGDQKVQLLRLRNPWGCDEEWNGPWSDGAQEWKLVTHKQREQLGLHFDNDGEFWMCVDDFIKHFARVELCNMNPDSLSAEDQINGKKAWDMSIYEGEWVKGCTAGGCVNHLNTFWRNPQYRITLQEEDENDADGLCTIIVALMQKHRRKNLSLDQDWLTIGFAIYLLSEPDRLPKPLNLNFFAYNLATAKSSFVNTREYSGRFKLPRGTYCIIPSAYTPREEGEFLLRVFSEKQNNLEEYDQEVGFITTEPPLEPEIAEATDSDVEMRTYFNSHLGDDDEIGWIQLKKILDITSEKNNEPPFTKDTCRSMIAMVDYDKSGKLCWEEFETLYKDLKRWKKVFHDFDVDQSKTLSGFELREALNEAGYTLNARMLNLLVHRYGNKKNELDLEDFINCAIKLRTMNELFEHKKYNKRISLDLKEWMESTLYS